MNYFLIPVFNEADNIPALFKNLEFLKMDEEVFYVFADDGSKDNSVGLLNVYFANTNYHIITDGKNYGPGHAFNEGFNWILNHSKNITNDFVITMEADNTSDYQLIPVMKMNAKMKFDLVLASVYAQGGGFEKTSFVRKLLSMIANFFLRTVFGIKVQTLSSFYRVYRLSLLQKIRERFSVIIEEQGFLCMIEVIVKSIRCKANIIEVPTILFSEKRKGNQK